MNNKPEIKHPNAKGAIFVPKNQIIPSTEGICKGKCLLCNYVKQSVCFECRDYYHHSQKLKDSIEIYEADCLRKIHNSQAHHGNCTNKSCRRSVYIDLWQPCKDNSYICDDEHHKCNGLCTHLSRVFVEVFFTFRFSRASQTYFFCSLQLPAGQKD